MELTSACLDFCVERFSIGVGGAVDKVVRDFVIVVADCFCNGAELASGHFRHFDVLSGKIHPGSVIINFGVEYVGGVYGKIICEF